MFLSQVFFLFVSSKSFSGKASELLGLEDSGGCCVPPHPAGR